MSANEYCIRTRQCRDVRLEEIADVYFDARGSEFAGILVDDGLALRTDLKSFDMQMGKLQTGLNGNASCAESNVSLGSASTVP